MLSTISGLSKLLYYFSRISASASDLTTSQIQHFKFPFRVKKLIRIDLPLQKIVQKRKRQKNQDKRIYSWVLHSSSNKLLTKEKLSSFTTKYLKLPTHTHFTSFSLKQNRPTVVDVVFDKVFCWTFHIKLTSYLFIYLLNNLFIYLLQFNGNLQNTKTGKKRKMP